MEPTQFSTAKILKVKNCTVSPCQPCSPVRQKHYWKNMAKTTKVTFQTQFSRAWYPKNQKGGGFTSHSNKSFLPCYRAPPLSIKYQLFAPSFLQITISLLSYNCPATSARSIKIGARSNGSC